MGIASRYKQARPDARRARTQTARIGGLDAIRGFALAGIIFVNIPSVLHIGVNFPPPAARIWLDTFVQGRFFPIFSLLFGIGFGMLWLVAPERTPHPRAALLRRLLFLGVLGALHQLLQPGEALLPYALAGLVFLLPATFLPDKRWVRWTLVGFGTALLIVGTWAGGGLLQIPGLFLLGFIVGLQKMPARVASSTSTLWIAGLAALIGGGISATVLQTSTWEQRADLTNPLGAFLGLLMSATYFALMLCLLHTPIRALPITLFASLGRMALTNYVSATLLMILIRYAFPASLWEAGTDQAWLVAMLSCVAILILQWVWSTLWLHYFEQGPLERLWRIVTWGK